MSKRRDKLGNNKNNKNTRGLHGSVPGLELISVADWWGHAWWVGITFDQRLLQLALLH